jgi:hypothetical protein
MDKFEKLPLRESMRRTHHKESYDMKIYDQGRQNYKIVSRYIDRCLKKSIGKNFDKVKKHMIERMCYNSLARYEHNLVEDLIRGYIGEGDKYMIDSQGRIQINEEYAKRRKGWRDRRMSKKLTLIDSNKDKVYGLRDDMTDSEIDILKTKLIINGSYNKSLFNHIVNGGTLSYVKYSDFIHSIKPDKVYKDKWGYWNHDYSLRDYVEDCFIVAEDNIIYVFKDGTAEYRQFKKEQQDQKRKTKRKREKELNEYYNNLLQDLENTKKEKECKKDIVDRDRLGFDDESFKGEPYHGQKRKKTT